MKLPVAEILGALPQQTTPIVEAVISRAERMGAFVYLVGGPVRDAILRRPVVDVDLIVQPQGSTDAEALAESVAPEGARIQAHGRFGTVTVSTPEASIDLATLRRESYRHAGALPKVEPGTLEEDLHRRDFSVNAMAIRLTQRRRSRDVEVIDPEGGLYDLERRKLTILHARSFHDDPTRALRAARLAPRLGFSLARGSLTALRDALRDGAFGAVSGDRIRREIEKLFDDVHRGLDPAVALRRLSDWHVLAALEPGLEFPRAAAPPVRRLGRDLVAPPWRGPRARSWVAGLAVWLTPLSPLQRARVLDRLSVRGDLHRRLREFPVRLDVLMRQLAEAHGRGAVDALLSGIDEEELYALHAWASTPVRRRIVRWAAEDRPRRVPISGADLAEIGLSGPAIGRALGRIRSAHLDGAVANREEALALAAELARNPKLRERSTRKARLGAVARAGKPHVKSRRPSKSRSSNKPRSPKKKNEAGADPAPRPRPRAGRK